MLLPFFAESPLRVESTPDKSEIDRPSPSPYLQD